MKRWQQILLFSGLFLLFLYWSLPYAVFKEYLSEKIQKATGMQVHMRQLSPSFPNGIYISGLRLNSTGGASLDIETIRIGVSLWRLLFAQGAVWIDVYEKSGEGLHVVAAVSLFSPGEGLRDLKVKSEAFQLKDITRFGLELLSTQQGANPLVVDLVTKLGIVGALAADVSLQLDPAKPSASKGIANVVIKDGALEFSEKLGIESQKFEKFLIESKIEGGKLTVSETTGVTSQGLSLTLTGFATLQSTLASSPLAMKLGVELKGKLKDQFGLLLELGLGGTNGIVQTNLAGTLASPAVVK